MDKKNSFNENPNDRYDTEMRLKALREGRENHTAKMYNEDRLAVPSYDESVVLDYIRNRVEPPRDITDGREIFEVRAIEQSEGDYEKDLKKLQALTKDELEKILTEEENKSKEGHGLFSKGDLLDGFAIDIKTLKSLQSVNHDIASHDLVDKIWEEQKESDKFNIADLGLIYRRIVKGFVYLTVPGFKTPIVKLSLGTEEMGDLVSKKDVGKIVNHLKRQRQLLPISSDFKVL